jgi:hypothetical protein
MATRADNLRVTRRWMIFSIIISRLFTGIPELFFSWMSITDKNIYFEFLDNDVPLGELPKTIAFGRNGSMTVLDPVALSNIDRFKEVNVTATRPEDVLNPEWSTKLSISAAMY